MATAPYPLPGVQQQLPDGEFLLPVCTTADRLFLILSALDTYERDYEPDDLSFKWDILAALAFVQTPGDATCA